MTEPNMTITALREWIATEAFAEYRSSRGPQTVDAVVRRTQRYLRGTASAEEERKVEAFIARMKANSSGAPKYGSGPTAVSGRTASLRNWGFDPTGRFR